MRGLLSPFRTLAALVVVALLALSAIPAEAQARADDPCDAPCPMCPDESPDAPADMLCCAPAAVAVQASAIAPIHVPAVVLPVVRLAPAPRRASRSLRCPPGTGPPPLARRHLAFSVLLI